MFRTSPTLQVSHWLSWGLGLLVVVGLIAAWSLRDHARNPTAAASPAAVPAGARSGSAVGSATDLRQDVGRVDRTGASDRRRWAAEGHWAGLPRAEQETLAPLMDDWIELSREQRQKWLEIAARFSSLSKDDQTRLRDRMQEWARMSPAERSQARLSFQEARQLSATERLERWEAYRGLDDDQRRQLLDETKIAQRSTSTPKRTEWGPPAPKGAAPADAAVGGGRPRPEGAITVRAPTGATTHLLNRAPMAGIEAAPGLRVSTSADVVDRNTLLPQVRSAAGSSSTAGSPAGAASAPSAADAPAPSASDADHSPAGDNTLISPAPAGPEPRPKTP